MDEIASIPKEFYLDVPQEYLGKRMTAIGFDSSGVDVHFEDKSILSVEDYNSVGIFASDETDFLYYSDAVFTGFQLLEVTGRSGVTLKDEYLHLILRTSLGAIDFRVYFTGQRPDIRIKEHKLQ